MQQSAPQIGLALGGGGGKGTAHVGVLHALEALRVPVDVLTGTSIGAIVGALYAAGYTPAAIAEWFQRGVSRRILERDATNSGLIGTGRIEALLREALGERTFADLRVPLAVVAVDLRRGTEVMLQEGPLVEAVLASIALPGIFPPVERDAAVLVDGGVMNNVPVDVAFRLGADHVIAVDLGALAEDFAYGTAAASEMPVWSPRRWLPYTQMEIAERALALLIAQVTQQRLALAPPSVLLRPDVAETPIFDFGQIDAGLRSGERAVLEQRAEIVALRDARGVDHALSKGDSRPGGRLTLPGRFVAATEVANQR